MSRQMLPLAVALAGALGLVAVAVAAVASTRAVNLRALPLGDGKVTTMAPRQGWVYSCGLGGGGGGAQADGAWIHGASWDATAKVTVDGAVGWRSVRRIVVSGATRAVAGNGLPSHPTGTFPVAAGDDAYAIDRNPNSIRAWSVAYSLPARPVAAAKPSCVGGGPIGVMLTGAALFDALDAENRDAAAHEVQDACDGHPEINGVYHYHSLSPCMDIGTSTTQHSKLVGYALDGFGIYGPRGDGGRLLSSADLDACHGTADTVLWNGRRVRMYHYVLTYDYPYSIGCFRGTPLRVGPGAAAGGRAGRGLPGLGGPGGRGGPPPPVPAG